MINLIQAKTNSDPKLKAELDACWNQVLKRTEVGFPQIVGQDWNPIEQRLLSVRPAQRVLVLGIGGSSLGPQVIYHSFRQRSPRQVYFLESPDPYTWRNLDNFHGSEWRDKHVVIISKSGNTLETLAWVEFLAAEDPRWLEHSQCTVIASPGTGPLQKWAQQEDVHCLWIPENVGGRFSVLTAVGMFPAGLMGLNLNEFREGARWALAERQLASALSSEILEGWKRGEWITQMWTYAEGLRIFGEWWQQLWGESLAKKLDRKGGPGPRVSTPMASTGPRDQHSLVQQLMEGANDKQIFINRVTALEESAEKFKPSLFPDLPFHGKTISLGTILGAEAQAFEQSLAESGIHFSTLKISEINERSLGALFMLWQIVTAQLGEYLGIDTFNQPGVELGKKYAAQTLRESN